MPPPETAISGSTFQRRATFGLSVAGSVAVLPFVVSNALSGEYIVTALGALFLVLAAFNIYYLSLGGSSPAINFFFLTPCIIVILVTLVIQQGLIGVLWCYPGLMGLYTLLPERRAWIANAVLLLCVSPAIALNFELELTFRMVATLLVASVFSVIATREITKQRTLLTQQVMIDPLTGLFNRTSLATTIEHAQQQSLRSDVAMTLLCLDIDHFKSINDNLGHAVGDKVLCAVARLLSQNSRRSDYVFRLGGEEFLILLFGSGLQSSRQVAEKLRAQIEAAALLENRAVTASFGVAELVKDEDPDQWLLRADQNMYEAKAQGRNRVYP